jgi:hypothetical protein
MSSKEYLILNIIFAALLFLLFIACFIFTTESFISCQVVELSGKECNSCGLTRDFIAFAHLDFEKALNENSIYLFFWFLIQLVMRIFIILLPPRWRLKATIYDLIFSFVSGIIVFLPLWI